MDGRGRDNIHGSIPICIGDLQDDKYSICRGGADGFVLGFLLDPLYKGIQREAIHFASLSIHVDHLEEV